MERLVKLIREEFYAEIGASGLAEDDKRSVCNAFARAVANGSVSRASELLPGKVTRTVGEVSVTADVDEKRARVVEWRLTRSLFGLSVRCWFEADPKWGGVKLGEAEAALRTVSREMHCEYEQSPGPVTAEVIAHRLINAIPSLSSVEVCDRHADGVCIHKDWP